MDNAMQRPVYLVLGAIFMVAAFMDSRFQEFAPTGGLLIVAEAILQLRDRISKGPDLAPPA